MKIRHAQFSVNAHKKAEQRCFVIGFSARADFTNWRSVQYITDSIYKRLSL